MDVREKLFTLFQDCNNPSWRWFPNNAEMMKLIEYLIAHGVTVQEWISAKDHPPETDGRYLVCTTWRGVVSEPKYGKYIKPPAQEGYWLVLTEFGYYPNSTVSHWMPRPKSPKGE